MFLQYGKTAENGTRMMIFSTDNIRYIKNSNFWLSEGTFKTAPHGFSSVYYSLQCIW